MKTTWVVVADEALARILAWPDRGDALDAVEELTDPAAHARGTELYDDALGRRAGSAGLVSQGAGHRLRSEASSTASAGQDKQHQEADAFARRVAQHLADALQQGRYEVLRVVAAPRFLGLLRKALSPQVQAVVADELDKDLVHATTRELSDRLFARAARTDQRGAPLGTPPADRLRIPR